MKRISPLKINGQYTLHLIACFKPITRRLKKRFMTSSATLLVLRNFLICLLLAFALLSASCATHPTYNKAPEVWEKYVIGGLNKAYAVGSNGMVAASWNQPSSQKAIQEALKFCKNGGGISCRVTHLNGKVYSTTTTKTISKQNVDVWREYRNGQNHKAYARGKNGVVGAEWNRASSIEALRAALIDCTDRGGQDCKVTHLNGEVYEEASVGSLNFTDVWNKYSIGGHHRAFASKGRGRGVGASWNQPSSAQAIEEALKACTRVSGSVCQIFSLNGSNYSGSDPEKAEKNPPKPAPAPKTIDEPTLVSAGTGFFLSTKGQIITNAHVVDDCSFARILYKNKAYDVSHLDVDQSNDLALLQSTITGNKAAPLEIDRIPRLGEAVIAFGYPLSSVLSSKPKITDGIISSTAGLGDDSRYFQISAPIQPGNSGGPLLDKFGRVIGITTAKLDDSWSIKNTGSIAQNVNFAIKSIVVRTFLDSNNVVINKPKQAPRQMSLPDIAEAADSYTVQVGCFK
jgi:S1-C subfamily serine protease